MGSMIPFIGITIAVLTVLVIVLFYLMKQNKGKNPEPDYYVFFILGICWIPIGISLDNYAFSIMGLAFMAIGLANKDKWKQNHRTWKQLDSKQQKLKLALITLLGALVLAGLIAYFLYANG